MKVESSLVKCCSATLSLYFVNLISGLVMSLIGSLLTMLVVSFFLQTHLSVPYSGSDVAFGSRI